MSRQEDDAELGIVGAQRLEEHEAVRVGQVQVDERDVRRVLGDRAPAVGRGRRTARGVAERLEELDERLAHGLVVVDDEEGQRHRRAD